jgi:hypothetical protein
MLSVDLGQGPADLIGAWSLRIRELESPLKLFLSAAVVFHHLVGEA